jgi:hypothetical protein
MKKLTAVILGIILAAALTAGASAKEAAGD